MQYAHQFLLRHPQIRLIGFGFLALNFTVASWLVRIPDLTERLQLSEGPLGLLLLGMPIGAFTGSWLAGFTSSRIGLVQGTRLSALGLALVAVLPGLAQVPWHLFVGLLLMGFMGGYLDVVVNGAAAMLEKKVGYPIMSSCHGMFSLGGFLGAGLGSLLMANQFTVIHHLLLASGLLLLGLLFIQRAVPNLTLTTTQEEKSGFHWPNATVLILAFMAFLIAQGEGAASDWSSLLFIQKVGLDKATAAWGLGIFSITMAVLRFLGDGLRQKIDESILLKGGGMIAVVGLALVVFTAQSWSMFLGLALTGVGYSIFFPLLFTEAAKAQSGNPQIGVAAISSAGIVGFMMGPPLMGGIAEWQNLNWAFGATMVLTAVAAGLAWVISRQGAQP
ncbi:MAG: MFS transporter [Bacteroidota bacterium]